MEPAETPCPVEGVVVPEKTRRRRPWFGRAAAAAAASSGSPAGVGATAEARKGLRSLVIYETKPRSSLGGSSGGGSSVASVALTLPLGPSTTLESVYDSVAKEFALGDQPFAICCNASGQALGLRDLHAGNDLVAYVDPKRPRPPQATEAGAETLPIPRGPKPAPFSHNFQDVFRPAVGSAHMRLMKEYGPVFKVTIPPKGCPAMVICDPQIAGQVIERPDVFQKLHFKHNKMIRGWVGQGVFTADDDEEIWGVAHRILLPAFSNQGMKQYFHIVQDCITRLFDKWDALAEAGQPVDLTKWTEFFTFDVIGKVGFGYDFGAIENETHPYLKQIQASGELSDARNRLNYYQLVLSSRWFLKQWFASNEPNIKFVQEIVTKRKAELSEGVRADQKDVLTLMLTASDPQTGQKLPPENVRDQILTFLLAGHDSTSTAITCLFMLLAQHGDVERRVVEEVERVIGDGPLTFEKLGKLEYCTAVINESLRMFPPAQAIRKEAVKDTTLGPYRVPKGTGTIISLWGLAHNPDTWPDPWRFDPSRWLGPEAKERSPYASIPFSVGPRGCLGRQLSIMEQRSILVHTVRRYHLRLHSRSHPRFTTPLFLKPHDIYLSLEKKATAPELPLSISASTSASASKSTAAAPAVAGAVIAAAGGAAAAAAAAATATPRSPSLGPVPAAGAGGTIDKAAIPPGTRVLLLYGSNMGTCEGMAGELAQHAIKIGMAADLMSLDAFLGKKELAKGAAGVIVISSTYNGTPPDNAAQFMRFLEDGAAVESAFKGVPVSVFGCGNTQWARTYQAVPRAIDAALSKAGATRLTEFASGDADSTMEESFEEWKFALWEGLSKHLGISGVGVRPVQGELVPAYIVTPTAEPAPKEQEMAEVASKWALQSGLFLGKVLENRELQAPASDRSTHHIEIQLPEEMGYTAGDHLAVLGGNPPEVVEQAAAALGLGLGEVVRVTRASPEVASTSLVPEDVPLEVRTILTWCVELQHPAPRAHVAILADRAACPPEKQALQAAVAAYEAEVLKNRRTLLELLAAHRSASLSLGELLTLLPPLKPRYYSISSSPRVAADRVCVTVGLVKGVTPTGRVHMGVCSNFLARRAAGQPVRCFVKDTKSSFRLPADGATPIILIGPGTGVAPLRGFLQDREASKATGPAILFFGCRNDDDYIYKDEMEAFRARGVLQGLHVAFSRKEKGKKVYVQHLIERESATLYGLLERGGHIYVCGDAKNMAPDVREAFAKVFAQGRGVPVEQGRTMVEKMVATEKYNEDVWASS